MTISQKILAIHAKKKKVEPGEFILAKVDLAFANDITAPLAIEKVKEWGAKKVFDPEKVVFILDHFIPNKDIKAAEQCKLIKEFARDYKLKSYFEVGRGGIEHIFLPEQGFVLPGDLIIGADSHSCTAGALGAFASGVGSTDLAAIMCTGQIWLKVPQAIKFIYEGDFLPWTTPKDLILYTIGDIGVKGASYRSMEFSGETVSKIPISGRLTICNMAVEAGAKNGIIEPDEITLNYIRGRSCRPYQLHHSDSESDYLEVKHYEVQKIQPQIAFPFLPSNVKPVSDIGKITIDQVFIGSCTNGSLDDLRLAASLFKGKKVHPEVRTIVIPATPSIYLQALEEGIIQTFVKAGAVVGPPTCGPCLGGHMGVLGKGERAVATTNRNFAGRMGHLKSEVYLANPAVAAASAIKGRIAHPEEVRG